MPSPAIPFSAACREPILPTAPFGPEFDAIFTQRIREADEFFAARMTGLVMVTRQVSRRGTNTSEAMRSST